jgi:Domain of unknown function (DUF4296)
MRIIIAGLIAVFFLAACGGGNGIPGNVLNPDKMQAVMWDMIKADVYAFEYIKRDSVKNDTAENLRLQKEIFAIHNTTRDAYYRSYDYYKKKPELMKTLMDTMSARANRVRNRASTDTRPAAVKGQ